MSFRVLREVLTAYRAMASEAQPQDAKDAQDAQAQQQWTAAAAELAALKRTARARNNTTIITTITTITIIITHQPSPSPSFLLNSLSRFHAMHRWGILLQKQTKNHQLQQKQKWIWYQQHNIQNGA